MNSRNIISMTVSSLDISIKRHIVIHLEDVTSTYVANANTNVNTANEITRRNKKENKNIFNVNILQ